MQGIFQKENTDKALKYGIYRHLPTYEKIIRNLVSFKGKTTLFVTDLRFQKILHRTTEDFCKAKNSLRAGFIDILVALFVHLN